MIGVEVSKEMGVRAESLLGDGILALFERSLVGSGKDESCESAIGLT